MSEGGSTGKNRQQEARAEGEVATQLICEGGDYGQQHEASTEMWPEWQAERTLSST